MLTPERIRALAEALADETVACRRTIHAYAELGGQEYQTSALVKQTLDTCGITWQAVGETGVLGILDTGRPGPCVALRADLDALPVPENPENLAGPRCCVSANPATSHACGHDAHTAMLLSAAKALSGEQEALCGKILFCFEAGEENGIGSRPMLAAMAAYPVDTCWAIHVYAGLESGKICLDDGPRMAGAAGEQAVQVFKTVAQHTAAMNNCSVSFGPQFNVVCGPVRNDPRCAALTRAAVSEVLPKGAVSSCEPWYASESFSRYCLTYPSVMAHLGICNPAYGSGAGHHNEKFDVDEAVLPMGVAATLAYVAAMQKADL